VHIRLHGKPLTNEYDKDATHSIVEEGDTAHEEGIYLSDPEFYVDFGRLRK
jgi:hypothetical protein